ncbi:MAG: ATP-binding protein [Kofleriaceae bacterium]|nr:ATP-binding protein [Kofleriaceae bacterium]
MSLAPDLAALVAVVRLRAEAAYLAQLNRGAGFADPRYPTQLDLRDPGGAARLGILALRPSDTHKKAAAAVAAALAVAEAAAPPSPLAALAGRARLTPAERALAELAVAVAIDDDARAYAHALAGKRKAALWLDVAGAIMPALASARARAEASHPRSPLVDTGLIAIDDAGLVSAHPRLAGWALGDARLPAPLDELATVVTDDPTWLPASVVDEAARVAGRIAAAAAAVLVLGPRGSGRRTVAARIGAALGQTIVVADLGELIAASKPDRAALVRTLLGECWLRGAVPVLTGADAMASDADGARAALAAIARGPALVILTAAGKAITSLPLGRPFHLIRMPRSDLDDRERAWAAALTAVGGAVPPSDAAELAGRYVLGPGAIAEVAAEAARFSAARGVALDRAAFEDAIGRRLSIRLGAFGSLVNRKARFDEMVLPEDVVAAMRDMIAMVRQRSTILERWGYQRHLGISRGVSALFSGEPGTGKTMAASVVASELGLELIRIDLSQVISKWVGETEKNLGRIFDEAHDANAMLLFDEADALFGKRTEVKSSQDRHANLEVNYILQRMESFDGVSVLTTNFESSIDQALQRRLNFRVRFPEPEVDERAALWQKLLPPATGLVEAPFDRLAERFEMTGGYIKNAIVRAAVIAAREERTLTVDDLWTGAHAEYAEMGKVLSTHTRT